MENSSSGSAHTINLDTIENPGAVLAINSSASPAASLSASGSDEYAHFFQVRLDLFDGPIDLLLHLVKSNELPIERLSLASITEQYLICVEQAQKFDLEIAAEYVVIAATLLSIKASVILAQPVELIADEEGNLIDPHEELLNRLREAQVYKNAARTLAAKHWLGIEVFASPLRYNKDRFNGVEPPPVQYKKHDALLLGEAFKKLLAKLPESSKYAITFDSVSIVETMMRVVTILEQSNGRATFSSLIIDVRSRGSIVASFIALLELCKRGMIAVRQGADQNSTETNEYFTEIVIELRNDSANAATQTSEGSTFVSEFDTPVAVPGEG